MTPTIGFDATAAVRQRAGIGRYTRELLRALSGRQDDFSFRLFSAAGGATAGCLPDLDLRFRHRAIPLSDRVTNAVWHRVGLPIPVQLVSGGFDLFHSPDFNLPPTGGKPSVITIHDLAFLRSPQTAYPTLRDYLMRVVPRFVRRADRIIAVSESTRRDIVELLGIDPTRITVVHEGVGSNFRPPEDREVAREMVARYGIDQPYILAVGTLEPRKNYVRLFEAYALLRRRGLEQRLVVAGRRGWLDEPILARRRELGLEEQIVLVAPADSDLPALYGLADCFVYPSLYEGFGLPPLEAMACGVPVACSASSSLPEVVGDAALLFEPLDVEAIAGALERVLSDPELPVALAAAGRARARQFTWSRAAHETVAVYREVLDG